MLSRSLALTLALSTVSSLSFAATPETLPLQGVFADSDGLPLNGDYAVDFTLTSLSDPGNALWSSERTITFDEGFFSIMLGEATPIDPDLFKDYGDLALSLAIDGDEDSGLIPLGSSPFTLSSRHAEEAGSLEGATLTDILDQIPADSDIEALSQGVCYDSVAELQAVLDSVYLSSGYSPDWSTISGLPADLADGDDDTTYSAGTGLLLSNGAFSVDQSTITQWALTATNVPGALDAVFDDYLTNVYQPSILDLVDFPADLADGDDDTTYTAGEGLLLDGESFSIDRDQLDAWVLETTQAPGSLDGTIGDYLSDQYVPSFSELSDVPAGLADGDDDTTYTAGEGLTLDGDAFSVDRSQLDAWVLETTQAPGSLDGTIGDYLANQYVPDFGNLSGVPSDLADGDDDTTYTAGAGLVLSGTDFTLDQALVTSLIQATAYDAESELLSALDDDYLPADYIPAWGDLEDIPDGIADGDDDTLDSLSCGTGQIPKWTGSVWACSDADFTGDLSVSGQLNAGSLAVTGGITAGSLSTTGAISAGDITASNLSASGAVSAGSLSAPSLSTLSLTTNTVSASNATISGTLEADTVEVTGTLSGAAVAGWDTNAANDLTTSTTFAGDVSGPYNAIVVANDSHSHGDSTISNNISVSNGNLHALTGGTAVGIGTTSPTGTLQVFEPDTQVAELYITGASQGSGIMFVGQSPTYGGGMAYDGDGLPNIIGGTDRITFFRRNNGTDTEVFSYGYSNSDVKFSGRVFAKFRTYQRTRSTTASGQCASCDSTDTVLGCWMSNVEFCDACDADIFLDPANSRCCTGSNDASGFTVVASCLDSTP